MKLSGHQTESVYRRYAIVSEADLRAGVAKLATLHGQMPTTPLAVVPLARTKSGQSQGRRRPGTLTAASA